MKETLKAKVAELKGDVDSEWRDFSELKTAVEAEGADSPRFSELTGKYESYKNALDAHDAAKEKLRAYLEMELSQQPKNGDKPVNGADTSNLGDGRAERKTPGERLVESPQLKAIQTGQAQQLAPVEVIDASEMKTLLTGVGAPGTSLLRNERLPGMMPVLREAPTRVSDLVTVVGTNANTVEWVRMTGFTNNAAEVAEATATAGSSGTKPESAMALTVENTTLQNIAHWIPATRQSLQDMPQLQGMVDELLPDGVRRRVNSQVINGDAVAPNLRGILNTAGIGTQALGADTRLDAIFKAITTIRLAFGEPNAILMHPSDWQDIALLKDSQGYYMAGSPWSGDLAQGRIFGLRVIVDTNIAAGTALVGDYASVVLYVNGGIAVYTTDSHSDFFIRNIIVFLAEGRFGVAVPRPSWFVQVTGI